MDGNSDDDESFGQQYGNAVDLANHSKEKAFTADPKTRRTINIAKDRHGRIELFQYYTKHGAPVYIIGVTNNKGDFNMTTEQAFIRLGKERKNAVLGQWIDKKGRRFRDTAFIISGITEEKALSLKFKYNQKEIVMLTKDEKYYHI